MNVNNCWAYHYYDDMYPPFINLLDNKFNEAVKFDHKGIYNTPENKIDYLKQRIGIEEIMLRLFKKKGGVPRLEHAHYFTLERADYFFRLYERPKCIKIPVSLFEKSVISFTFGDSFEVFFTSTHPTRRKLYTLEEINEIMNIYYHDKKEQPFYIEMQLWDDPYKYYENMEEEPVPEYLMFQYSLDDVFQFKQKEEYKHYKSFINSYHYNNPKGLHGIKHALRVLLFCIVLSELYKLNKNEKDILCLSAIYHDIGRTSDGIDDMHGYKSWHKIIQLKILNHIPEKQKESIEYIIVNHCNDKIDKIIDSKTKFLYELFKDADALDRVRINDLNYGYLRNEYTHKLIKLAWAIYCEEDLLFVDMME